MERAWITANSPRAAVERERPTFAPEMKPIRMARAFMLIAWLGIGTVGVAQRNALYELPDAPEMTATNEKLTVEIWSDVVCPFCYIGKREFEHALARFAHREEVEVIWRSFELDPTAPERSEFDMYGMLVARYGGTRESAASRVAGVVERARSIGLEYHMDKAVIGSSFDAHRLLQYARTQGLGPQAKERLFRAYFTEGCHIADTEVLVRLATEIGLESAATRQVIASDRFTDAVRADEREARALGVQGVPFFVLDRRYAVSGAQVSDRFLEALQQAWEARKTGE
ncbi:MAG: DsbA family oxidoreductase [Flavobacteriales bacterium]|nr:DsbA family oxidoreductase [Flavobacteriales bacterium]